MGYLITKDNKRKGVDQKIPISDNVIYGRPGLFDQQRLSIKKISNFDTNFPPASKSNSNFPPASKKTEK